MDSEFALVHVSSEDVATLYTNNKNSLQIEVHPIPQSSLFVVKIVGTWQAIISLVNHVTI